MDSELRQQSGNTIQQSENQTSKILDQKTSYDGINPAHNNEISSLEFEQVLKNMKRVLALCLSLVSLAIVADLKFWWYLILSIIGIKFFLIIRIQIQDSRLKWGFRSRFGVILGSIMLVFVVLLFRIFSDFQLEQGDLKYSYVIPNFTHNFYRIGYPQSNYERSLHNFMNLFNYKQVLERSMSIQSSQKQAQYVDSQLRQKVQDVTTNEITVWSSDAMRFDFLFEYWSSSTNPKPNFVCIMESDVAIDLNFFKERIESATREKKVSIVHVQSKWREKQFEKYNIGVLCGTRNPGYFTWLWVQVMKSLHQKRFRRLIYYPLMFGLLPNRQVIEWDPYGCSWYVNKCKYIHFTKSKKKHILEGIHFIKKLIKVQKLYIDN